MKNSIITERVRALRNLMQQYKMDAFIIPSSDPHMSEYPAKHWKSRTFISGFTGSAGTVVVTATKAGLWTDSRYFLQAADELKESGIELYKAGLSETIDTDHFLLKEVEKGGCVGFDGSTFSQKEVERLSMLLARKEIRIEPEHDLIGAIWEERPKLPENQIFLMPEELSGETTEKKLIRINDILHQNGADCLLVSALDEVAWCFNLRGTDVDYNPVAIAYAFISEEETVLFINPKKLNQEVTDELKREGIITAHYDCIATYLSKLPAKKHLLADKRQINHRLFKSIPEAVQIIDAPSPITALKGIKNETELKGFRNAVVKDGVALVKFQKWLEEAIASGEKPTEMSASTKLTELRSEQDRYISDSFATICGYAEHGAIVHYEATPETDAELKAESFVLIDSGAQYLDGTTDITRTIALGEPTEAMMKDYTRVLKGTISLAKCKFPVGTRGSQLDILARKALWDSGLNYLHGTGHGIGHCLNVHEGPQSIRMEENNTPLQPGMVTSDEPGLYKSGEYGIRIENMILTRTDSKTEFGEFLSFETLTLCPIDTRPIVVGMLSVRERAWLNKYHQKVYETLAPLLNDEEKEWLKSKTEEI